MTKGAALAGALAVVVVARRCRRVVVTGSSMRPTLESGDRLLVVRAGRPRPGHLVVMPDPRQPDRLLVKRAAAVRGGAVTIQGDNPASSTDSRDFGPVPVDALRGRAVYRYGPPERAGWLR
jgi:nickel-type superoxide dismutase maturation protease